MYEEIKKNVFNCTTCPTRCDGKSKMKYSFTDDVDFAETQEEIVREKINKTETIIALKSKAKGYPDIEVYNTKGKLEKYIEVKAQKRTFMIVRKLLPNGALEPSETVALNESDLIRYIKIAKETGIQTGIIWCVMNRPCIVEDNEVKYYHQSIKKLESLHKKYGTTRRFRRASGKGDVVDGEHKGVVVNYHFSLNELIEW